MYILIYYSLSDNIQEETIKYVSNISLPRLVFALIVLKLKRNVS